MELFIDKVVEVAEFGFVLGIEVFFYGEDFVFGGEDFIDEGIFVDSVDGAGLAGAVAGLIVMGFFEEGFGVSEDFSGVNYFEDTLSPLVGVSSEGRDVVIFMKGDNVSGRDFGFVVGSDGFGEVELSIFDEVDVLDLVAFCVEGSFVLTGEFGYVVEEGLDAVTVDFFEQL